MTDDEFDKICGSYYITKVNIVEPNISFFTKYYGLDIIFLIVLVVVLLILVCVLANKLKKLKLEKDLDH